MSASTGHVQKESNIDREAYLYACSKLRGRATKGDLDLVTAMVKGIPVQDLKDVVELYLERTGFRNLPLKHLAEICGWFRRGYTVREMQHGIEKALETGTVYSPLYVTPHIHQRATGSAARELGVGRGPR